MTGQQSPAALWTVQASLQSRFTPTVTNYNDQITDQASKTIYTLTSQSLQGMLGGGGNEQHGNTPVEVAARTIPVSGRPRT